MLARIAQSLLAVEAGVYAWLLYGLAIAGDWPFLAWLGLVEVCAIGLRGFIVSVMFAVSYFAGSPTPKEFRIDPVQTVALFVREWWAYCRLYAWYHPFANWILRDEGKLGWEPPGAPTIAAPPNPYPVLFIHGFFCNRGYWTATLRDLHARGLRRLYTISVDPTLGDIDRFAAQTRDKVEAICAATGSPRVVLVGQSMGGLTARAYAAKLDDKKRVATIVSLGTPHNGTAHAYLAVGKNASQMRLGNAWLADLATRESEQARPPITSIFSYHDNIVAPQTSSILVGQPSIPLAGIGHLEMTFSEQMHSLVYNEILKTREID